MKGRCEMKGDIACRAERRLRLEMEKQALLSIKKRLDSLRFWMPASGLSKLEKLILHGQQCYLSTN